ncbi:hypothetical protein [Streptomyces violaceusniger]|uniref:Uncharacterized protein n=1 Tax=Streptomyces violaceusniger (strain Tu 4113) TaxID=653045 RepID=G2PF01_STRV4|nr:hypothetical protein [Streptomyces violaceusniger]AEM84007.1 hypothetical protein Strvi_4363 [Streptomyces violaceusniger Tu 4113]
MPDQSGDDWNPGTQRRTWNAGRVTERHQRGGPGRRCGRQPEFPLGAFVTVTVTVTGTGTGAPAARTGSVLFTLPAVVLHALLIAAWAVVACGSLGHAAAHAGGRRAVRHPVPVAVPVAVRLNGKPPHRS